MFHSFLQEWFKSYMPKYIKLINYSIIMLCTKICKNRPPVHSRFHICGWYIQTQVSIPYDLSRSRPDIPFCFYNIGQCSVYTTRFACTIIRHFFLQQFKNTVHLNRQFLLEVVLRPNQEEWWYHKHSIGVILVNFSKPQCLNLQHAGKNK
jgi:hypothetical protein